MAIVDDQVALQNDIKQVKDVVDLLDANVMQILEQLEVLPTLATKDDLAGMEARMEARIDEVLKAIKEHNHGP